MPTFINEAVLSLPEQVEKNKKDIKAIEETIGGIDPDLINQVHTNTSDISAIKQEQIVQNTAINQNGGKITSLETKTANINTNGTQYGSVEKVANTDGVMEISADGLTIESADVLDILTPNANINVNNSGVVKISNDNNTNKLEYDGANGSFKVSGGHTLEFNSATGDLLIDGGAVGGGNVYTHIINLGNVYYCKITSARQEPYTIQDLIDKLQGASGVIGKAFPCYSKSTTNDFVTGAVTASGSSLYVNWQGNLSTINSIVDTVYDL